MDPTKLANILSVLREYGVTEYSKADLHIVMSSAEPRPVAQARKDTGESTNSKAAAYAKLFRNGPPSFEKYRDAGLVTGE